jgi:hypothetical protein
MTDPTPTPSNVPLSDTVKADVAVVEAKAMTVWSWLGNHAVLVVLVLGAAAFGVLKLIHIL